MLYTMTYNVTGLVTVGVEADSVEDAIKKGREVGIHDLENGSAIFEVYDLEEHDAEPETGDMIYF